MNFTVVFDVEKLGGTLIDNYNPGKGLDIVKEVREIIGEDIKPSIVTVSDACPARNGQMEKNIIDEEMVYKSSKFNTSNEAKIIVLPGFFGQFMVMKTRITRRVPTTKWGRFKYWIRKTELPIKSVSVFYDLDWDAVIEKWVKDKYPSYWGITEKEYNRRVDFVKERNLKEIAKRKEEVENERLLMVDANNAINSIRQIKNFVSRLNGELFEVEKYVHKIRTNKR